MSTAKSLYALRVIWTLRGATPLSKNPSQIWPESSRNHEKHDFQGLANPRLTCQGPPSPLDISSYSLPQELRLIPSDAEWKDLCWKNLRIENEFTDFSLEAKHLMKTILLSVTEKLPTTSPLLPNYSKWAPLKAYMLYESLFFKFTCIKYYCASFEICTRFRSLLCET